MPTSNILDSIAVARRSEGDAATILQAYISTGPQMAQTYAPQAAPVRAPTPAPGMGGSGQQTQRAKSSGDQTGGDGKQG